MSYRISFFAVMMLLLFSMVSAQHEITFTLVNKTGFELVDIFISAADQNQWSEDLSLGVFNDLEAKDFHMKTTEKICQYDLKAIRPDSTELLFKGVNLCKKLIVTLLYEFDQPMFVQDIILENLTDFTFSEIYVRDLTTSFWGQNVLGANALTRNEKAVISIPPGNPNACLYDIKGVLMNGREVLYNSINICNQAHIVLMRYQGKPYYGFD
jgi:hypothetical protein